MALNKTQPHCDSCDEDFIVLTREDFREVPKICPFCGTDIEAQEDEQGE